MSFRDLQIEIVTAVLRFVFRHLLFLSIIAVTLFIFSVILVAGFHKDAKALYIDGMEAVSKGQYDAALDFFREIEWNHEKWARMDEVIYQEGVILYFHKGDLHSALERWAYLMEHFPTSRFQKPILIHMADIYQEKLMDHRAASAVLKRLWSEFPDDPHANEYRFRAATAIIRVSPPAQAVTELDSLLRETSDSHFHQQIQVMVGSLENTLKHYSKAQEVLEPIVSKPHCERCRQMAMLSLADTLELGRDYRKAVDILGRIPDNVIPRSDRNARINRIQRKGASEVPVPNVSLRRK